MHRVQVRGTPPTETDLWTDGRRSRIQAVGGWDAEGRGTEWSEGQRLSGGSCHLCPRCLCQSWEGQEGQVEVAGWPGLTSVSCTEALMCLPGDWHSVGQGAALQPFFHDPVPPSAGQGRYDPDVRAVPVRAPRHEPLREAAVPSASGVTSRLPRSSGTSQPESGPPRSHSQDPASGPGLLPVPPASSLQFAPPPPLPRRTPAPPNTALPTVHTGEWGGGGRGAPGQAWGPRA